MKKGWQTKKLGDVAVVGAGNSAPQDEALFKDGTVPFFRTADAGRVRFGDIGEAADYLNDKGVKGLRRFAPGTILFPKSGASTFLNHRVILGVEGCVSSHLATIVADKKQAHPRFLLYFLSTIAAQDLVQDHAYPSLNLPTIAGIEVHLPPLAEQQRIVGLLDEAFDGLATAKANAGKNLQNARALFESHLQSVFTQRGPGWVEKPLRVICDFSQGVQVDVKLQSEIRKDQSQVRFLRIVDFTQGNEPERFIDNPGEKFLVCQSDISLVRYGASTGFVCRGLEGAIANNLFRVIPKDGHVLNDFLYWFLKSPAFQDEIKEIMNGAAMPAISFSVINEITVAFPPQREQPAIVSELESFASETQRLARVYEQKLAALDALKKSLLHQAFAGEL